MGSYMSTPINTFSYRSALYEILDEVLIRELFALDEYVAAKLHLLYIMPIEKNINNLKYISPKTFDECKNNLKNKLDEYPDNSNLIGLFTSQLPMCTDETSIQITKMVKKISAEKLRTTPNDPQKNEEIKQISEVKEDNTDNRQELLNNSASSNSTSVSASSVFSETQQSEFQQTERSQKETFNTDSNSPPN